MRKVNVAEALDRIDAPWRPHVAAQIGDCEVKLAKLDGAFVWHHHDDADEMFLVVSGSLKMRYRQENGHGRAVSEREVELGEGEFLVVPAGTEHMPVTDAECHVLLFEPRGTVNTGNATDSELTVVNTLTI